MGKPPDLVDARAPELAIKALLDGGREDDAMPAQDHPSLALVDGSGDHEAVEQQGRGVILLRTIRLLPQARIIIRAAPSHFR